MKPTARIIAVVALSFGTMLLPPMMESKSRPTNTFDDTGHHPIHETFQEHPELRSVGRIFSQDYGEVCTATLVAPRVIVTAAHCFFEATGALKSQSFVFDTGADTRFQVPWASIKPESAVALTANFKQNPERDVAFATLEKKLDSKRFPPLPLEPLKDFDPLHVDVKVSITSYPVDADGNMNFPMTESGCDVPEVYFVSKEFTHNCSTLAGSSGGPLWLLHDGHIVIVGVHNGAAHSTGLKSVHFSSHTANRAVDSELIKPALDLYLAGKLRPDTL